MTESMRNLWWDMKQVTHDDRTRGNQRKQQIRSSLINLAWTSLIPGRVSDMGHKILRPTFLQTSWELFKMWCPFIPFRRSFFWENSWKLNRQRLKRLHSRDPIQEEFSRYALFHILSGGGGEETSALWFLKHWISTWYSPDLMWKFQVIKICQVMWCKKR